MLKYLLLLLTALSLPCFADYQSVEAKVKHKRHKEVEWSEIYDAPGHLKHFKIVIFSDGKIHFSGKISTDSNTIQWRNFFHFIYGGSFFSIPANDGWIGSPCVKYGSDYEWTFESTFDASLYDKIDSVMLFGGCFECGE